MSKILISLSALLMLVIAPSVHADPIVITSGFISVTGLGGGPTYSLSGQNFSATGAGEQGFTAPQTCSPCPSGTSLGLASTFIGTSIGGGSVTINGMTFTNIAIDGILTITGTPLTVPAALTDITISGPFSLVGSIIGCELPRTNCNASNALFTTDLTGQGTATVSLIFDGIVNGNSLYSFRNVTYNFQSAEIPEPLTIALLATGLVGLGARLKFRSSGSRPR